MTASRNPRFFVLLALATSHLIHLGDQAHGQTKVEKKTREEAALDEPASRDEPASVIQRLSGRWACSMHPHVRQAEPGKCPICAMTLVAMPHEHGLYGRSAELPSLQEMLAVAMRHSPDVRAAQAKLAQTRVEVAFRVVEVRERWRAKRAELLAAAIELNEAERAFAADATPRDENSRAEFVETARHKVQTLREELIEIETVLPLLLGNPVEPQLELHSETGKREVERMEVSPSFQRQVAAVWRAYLPIQRALAADDHTAARRLLASVRASLAAVDTTALDERTRHAWKRRHAALQKIIDALQHVGDMRAFRKQFSSLSEEVGVLAKAFGFGDGLPVYEHYCPMAFDGRGATWYQASAETKNPYFGSAMLRCATKVHLISPRGHGHARAKQANEHDRHRHD